MEKLLALFALASTAAGQHFGSIPQVQAGQLVSLDSCAHVVDCFGNYPLKPGHTRDEYPGTDPNPPRIIPGYVVPNHTIGPGDPNCPAGNCIPIDPNNICNAYGPDCLPGVNVYQPPLKCDPKHPRCPPNGFLVVPGISCHPAGKACVPGGVITTPGICKPGEHCPCGCGTYLPPWITGCHAGTPGCPNGHQITDPPRWPNYPPEEPHIPGWPWNPNNLCDASLGGHCDGNDIVVPNGPKDECDARKPGCIPQVNIPPTTPPADPKDPHCPNGHCVLVPTEGCHPNDPSPPPGCVHVNPIPCPQGVDGCAGGVENPPLVNPCKPGTPGCSHGGHLTPTRPIVKPNDPVPPKERPGLQLDPNGEHKCSFVEVPKLPDGKLTPEQCTAREQDMKPHFYGTSKFPCTRDDKNPTLGPELHGAMTITIRKDGTYDDAFKFSEDSILQFVATGSTEQRPMVQIDGNRYEANLGKADPNSSCSLIQGCVDEGAARGWVYVPAGFHAFKWIIPDYKQGDERKVSYRFYHVPKCLPEQTEAVKPQEGFAVSPDPPYVEVPKPETMSLQPPPVPTQTQEVSRDPPQAQQPAQQKPIQVQPPPQQPPAEQPAQAAPGSASPPPAAQPPPAQQPPAQQPPAQEQPPPAAAQPQGPVYKDFPCTEDKNWPCRGAELQKWDNMWFKWNSQYRRPGPPAPWVKEINYPQDTIFTLTDVENYVEHFEVFLDGKSIGETEEGPQHKFPDRWRAKCGHGEPERCMRDGWSHGFFRIPAGPHTLSISWTKGDFNNWVYATGMYRFDSMCTC